jgi:glutamyl-tRNA synthetase
MKEVRTRFAPSPTGFLHVGGVRTNFYAWLLARHFGGKFLLRIEDTDQERLVPGAIKAILDDMKWLGMDIDEGPSMDELKKVDTGWEGNEGIGGAKGPYIQSLRLNRYKEAADNLVQLGVAYRCDCTPEMLEKERADQMARRETPGYSGYCRHRNVSSDSKHVVRFKMDQDQSLTLDDAVKGKVVWEKISLRDPVLLKSDGFPTYHLAVVVDDHDMGITHVMRGEEWLATAPIHVLLYKAFGWDMPSFSHLPNVLGQDGRKLSKRHGSTHIKSFREAGYLPEALMNFLLLVGWNPGEGEQQEIFTKDEMIKKFSLERVNNAAAVFSYDKLNWMNGMYIRGLSKEKFVDAIRPYLLAKDIKVDEARLAAIAPHIQERMKFLNETPDLIDFLFKEKIERDLPAMMGKDVDAAKAKEIIAAAIGAISAVSDFTVPNVEAAVRSIPEKMGLKVGPVFAVIRISVTGKKITPPLFESMVVLGKDTTLARLKETIELV